jgi:hypothetical protein
MRRMIAGLIALLVFCATMHTGDSEAGWRRRARRACRNPACCPDSSCCGPRSTTCCPSTGRCDVLPLDTAAYMCISGLMFTYVDNTCSYVGTCYNDNSTCAVPPGYTCMEDLDCGLPNQSCSGSTPRDSNCHSLSTFCCDQCGNLHVCRFGHKGLSQAQRFNPNWDHTHLGHGVNITESQPTFLTFDTMSLDASGNAVPRPGVCARVLHLTLNGNDYYIGYEVQPLTVTDPGTDCPDCYPYQHTNSDFKAGDGVRIVRRNGTSEVYRIRIARPY